MQASHDDRRRNGRRWWLPITVVVVCLSLAIIGALDDGHVTASLGYRRDAIAQGAWWRLVTAHFVHLSLAHAALDGVGLLLVVWIFGAALGPTRQVAAGLLGIVAVDAGLWFFQPEVGWYVGLSGALNAWFVVGALAWACDTRRDRRAWGVLLLAGLCAKLLLEWRHQAFWLDDGSLAVVTAAHRWGAVGGALYGIGVILFTRRERGADVASRDRHRRG